MDILTVEQFYKCFAHSPIKVMSGYNGKVLAKRYNPKKHKHISDREVTSVWSEMEVSKSGGFSQIALPMLCIYVNGKEEYEAEHGVSYD